MSFLCVHYVCAECLHVGESDSVRVHGANWLHLSVFRVRTVRV